jgi:hypothetical protein
MLSAFYWEKCGIIYKSDVPLVDGINTGGAFGIVFQE